MWTLDTRWLDVAAFSILYVVLTVAFGRFEEHKPAWRRLLKFALLLSLLLLSIQLAGRAWGYAVLGLLLAAGTALHFIVMSNAGINGWNGEPREKFEALLRDVHERGEARALWNAVSGERASDSRHTRTR